LTKEKTKSSFGENVSIKNRIRNLQFAIDLLKGDGSIKAIATKNGFHPTVHVQLLGRIVSISDMEKDLAFFRYARGMSLARLSEARRHRRFWLDHIINASKYWGVHSEINTYLSEYYKTSDFVDEIDPNKLKIINNNCY